MPVIVNDFEVLVDSAAAQTGSATVQPVTGEAQPQPPLTPETVEKLVRRALARRLRLLAD